jgi:hypothetical protein
MAVLLLPVPLTEQTPSLRYGIARSSQTEHHCPICGKTVDINTSNDDAATAGMHEGCYVLRQMLKQSTTPSTACQRNC